MEAIGISVTAGIWAGVVGWWYRASTFARRWVDDARKSSPVVATQVASSVQRSQRVWSALTGATAATVAASSVLGRCGAVRMLPFLLVWATGLALLALTDQETLLLPGKLVRLCTFLAGCLLLTDAAATSDWHYLGKGLLCAVGAFATFGLWASWRPNSLGFGDARFACLVALGAGALSPAGCVVALACAPAVSAGISTSRARFRAIDQRTPIALGPFLALAGIAVAVASAI
jgi:hypothetical protein